MLVGPPGQDREQRKEVGSCLMTTWEMISYMAHGFAPSHGGSWRHIIY